MYTKLLYILYYYFLAWHEALKSLYSRHHTLYTLMATLAVENHEVAIIARQLASNVPVREKVKKYAVLNTKIDAATK